MKNQQNARVGTTRKLVILTENGILLHKSIVVQQRTTATPRSMSIAV